MNIYLSIKPEFLDRKKHVGLSKAAIQIHEFFQELQKKEIIKITYDINDNVDFYVFYSPKYENVIASLNTTFKDLSRVVGKIIYITTSLEYDYTSMKQIEDLFYLPPRMILTNSEFSVRSFRNSFEKFIKKLSSRPDISEKFREIYDKIIIDYFYLYCDGNVFTKLSEFDKEKFKNELGLTTKFNFIFNGAITNEISFEDRKQIFRLILLFNKVFGDNKDVGLIIKTLNADNYSSSYMAVDKNRKLFENFLKINKISNNVYFIFNNQTDEQINMLYNMCDVYLSISSGEGFGYTLIEAALAGLPVAAINYSAYIELIDVTKIGHRMIKIPTPLYEVYSPFFDFEEECFPLADEEDFIKKVKRLYEDKDYYNGALEIAKNNRNKILSKLDKEKIVNKISSILSKCDDNRIILP